MSKHIWKQGVLLSLAMTMIVMCSGCWSPEPVENDNQCQSDQALTTALESPVTDPPPTEDPLKQAYDENPAAFVVFSQSADPQEVYIPLGEIMDYRTQYPDCNSTWYRDQQEKEALGIYNSYLYAMEHCYTGFEIYVEEDNIDFSMIRLALALDSPFLAQNTSRLEDISEWFSGKLSESTYIGINHFASKRWEKKMEALEKCHQIVEEIPEECAGQLEKMEYLYRYVCDHVKYVEYETMMDEDYLYDAVMKGETVCDGYSNMLLLLFRLIGVECCEVVGSDYEDINQLSPEERRDAAKHTWVAARLDDEWYYFDPTFEDTKGDDLDIDTMYFGFSDVLVEHHYMELEAYVPKCTDPSLNFDYADVEVSSFTKSADVKKIAEITQKRAKRGNDTTLVAIHEPITDAKYEKMVKKFWRYANRIESVEGSYIQIGSYTLLWITAEL